MGGWTRRSALRSVGLAATAVLLSLPAPAGAAAPVGTPNAAERHVDRRAGGGPGAAQAPERVRAAQAALRRRFGAQLVLGADTGTGATQVVQRLDGALSSPAEGDRARVARDWLRDNRDVLGVDAATIDKLEVAARETAGAAGLTTIKFAQRFRGVEVYDGGFEVTLDRGGRVLAAVGRPADAPRVASVEPTLNADAARAALSASVGPTQPAAPAELTFFPAAGGTRLAWRLLERRSSVATYAAVVDAASGVLLLRQNLTKSAAPTTVFPNYPGAEGAPVTGGANAPRNVDLEAAGYLPTGATGLSGPYARAFSDVDDDDLPGAGEEVAPDPVTGFDFGFSPQAGGCPSTAIAATPQCTWNPAQKQRSQQESWQINREQNAVQAFWLVNRFRDHLARTEIGFGDGPGAEGFAGADRVVVHARDGAAIRDAAHLNNANITVLPEGLPPTMQMYLFAGPRFRAIDSGDDAATVWHEYTHGLSGRLVTHADGTSALASVHAGALGEAWSDFYALDLLHRDGLEVDDPTVAGEVDVGAYSDAAPHATRSQGADCAVGAPALACPGRGGAGPGGYTLGDLGRIFGGAEVHYDGEIWLETLWDIRQALVAVLGSETVGSDAAERLVTDSMRLSPPEPSFLDARNAMLAADTAAGGQHRTLLWTAFARRGMGFYADVDGPEDRTPTEDFSTPPPAGAPTGRITGRVIDAPGALPLAGVRVATGGPSGNDAAVTTGADGRYALVVPAGAAPRVLFSGPAGYDPVAVPRAPAVLAGADTAVDDVGLRRDWASAAGGGRLESDPRGFCGPAQLLDEVAGSGWSAFRTTSRPTPSVTITLPAAIDVTAIAIDPAATCGSGPEAALRDLRVEAVRPSGTFELLRSGFSSDDEGRLNLRRPAGNALGVTALRVTLLASRAAGDYVDLAALAVYGTRSDGAPRGALRATPATVAPGEAVGFDASSFFDPDSLITSYAWDFDGDGAVDRETPGPRTSFAYDAPGAPEARVTVRDAGGAEGRAAAVVRITGPVPAGAAPAPPPAPPVPAPAPPPKPPAPVAAPPTLRVAGSARRSSRVVVRCASACSVKASGSLSTAMARRLGRSRRSVFRTFRLRAGTTTLTLRLPKATLDSARRRGVRTLRLTLELRAADAAGRVTSRRVAVRVLV